MNDYYRVIVTGGRDRDSDSVFIPLMAFLQDPITSGDGVIIVQGGCPTGADKAARDFAEVNGLAVETHEADWQAYGRAAGPIRNKAMAELGADCCFAFPGPGKSPGTWNMIKEATKAGIMTLVLPANLMEGNNERESK